MKKVILGIFIFFIFCTSFAFAQSPQEIYRKANLNYENEDYQQAISYYEMLIEIDKVSPEVFYNLGNSYFKLKRVGKAILNYERAKRLEPRDRDISLNLKLAKGMMVDKIDLPQRGFILDMILFLYDRMNVNELTILVWVFYLAIMILLMFSIFIVSKRKTFLYTVGMLSVFLILFVIFLFSKINSENFVKKAIVISQKVDVRSGPKEDYLLQFTLHEGAEIYVVEERQSWYEISLSKDLRGWLPKDAVEII